MDALGARDAALLELAFGPALALEGRRTEIEIAGIAIGDQIQVERASLEGAKLSG